MIWENRETKVRPLPDADKQLGVTTLVTWVERKTPNSPKELVSSNKELWSRLSPDRKGRQKTISQNHDQWDRRHNKPRTPVDVGGPFFSQKQSVTVVDPSVKRISGKIQWDQSSAYWSRAEYTGPILAFPVNSVVMPLAQNRSEAEMNQMGAIAISRCKPTNQVADAATFLAETYREGLPKLAGSTLWKKKIDEGRKAGGEYLNLEFGWKPFLSDVREIFTAITHARDVLQTYESGSGKKVRRRYVFPDEVSQITTQGTANDFVLAQNHPALRDPGKSPAVWFRTSRLYRKVWFSGSFTYHIPKGYFSSSFVEKWGAKADALLGTSLTPEVLWNAMPWSWAVDWFSNAGDVISNLSDWSTDGLVLNHGYVMEHSIASNTYFHNDGGRLFQPNIIGSPVVASVETKQRFVATPFGFGVDWSSLTGRQLAIISALGLTKRPR